MDAVDCNLVSTHVVYTHTTRLAGVLPACETDNPANSINWSNDHPPISMRSLSRAAASLEEIACWC